MLPTVISYRFQNKEAEKRKNAASLLMTNAIFLSDLSETLISDSSNFLKNKMFLREFFPSGVTKI